MHPQSNATDVTVEPAAVERVRERRARIDRDDLIAALCEANFETGVRAVDLWPAG